MTTLLQVISALFLLAAATVAAYQPGYLVPLVLAAANGLALIWLTYRNFQQEFPWYAPTFFLLGWFFLIECITPLTTIYLGLRSEVFNAEIPATLWTQSFFVTSLALAGIGIGQKLFKATPSNTLTGNALFEDRQDVSGINTIYAIVVGGVAIAAWLYMYNVRGGLLAQLADQNEGRQYMIYHAGGTVWHLAKFGFAACFILIFYRGAFHPTTLAILVPIGLFLTIYGSRTFTANLLLGALVVYAARRLKPIPFTTIAAFIPLLFIVATFLGIVRATKGDFSEAFYVSQDKTGTTDGLLAYIFGNLTFLIQRSELIDYLQSTNNYQYGKTFLSLFKIIPDFILPGNNQLPSGNMFYLENLQPDKVGKISLTSNFFTEMYINFWYPGVVAGGVFLGAACRWLDVHLKTLVASRAYMRSGTIACVAAVLSMQLFSILKSGVQTFLETFYFLLPLVPLIWMNYRSHSSVSPQTHNQP